MLLLEGTSEFVAQVLHDGQAFACTIIEKAHNVHCPITHVYARVHPLEWLNALEIY